MTVAEKSKAAGGRSSGFDYLRIALAISIILWHGLATSYGWPVERVWWQGPFGIAFRFVLPMFFALSGYLVAGSLDRCPTLVSFFGLRVLRIVPALSVEVTLSALIMGPLLTTLPLAAYMQDPQLRAYFLNVVGDIHYTLPGLFAHNPRPFIVNGQLWTIPSELQCYLVMGGLAATAIVRSRAGLLVLTLACQALWLWHGVHTPEDWNRAPLAPGPVLVVSFLCGILVHLYRDRIGLTPSMFWPVLLAAVGLACLPNGAMYLPFPAAYLTVYLGLLNPRRNSFLASGDYSYGLYLYGYPLQQALASMGPWARHWWINVGLVLPGALIVAVLSWHTIEKPALGLRRFLPVLEARIMQILPSGVAGTSLLLRGAALLPALLGIALLVNGNERRGSYALALAMIVCFASAVRQRTTRRTDTPILAPGG